MATESDDESVSWSCWIRTTLAASGSMIAVLIVGVNEAQSSVMLPQLRQAESVIHVTPDEETWIASVGVILTPISVILVGPFIDMFGRKRGILCFYFLMTSGFGIMACAQNVYHIYVGRIICGVGIGFQPTLGVYIAEICTTKQRQNINSAGVGMASIGVALSTIIGGYLPWALASLIYACTCCILFILEFFIPESPAWLFKMGRENACTQSLQRLGRSQTLIHRELAVLKLSRNENTEKIDLKTFLKPTIWKPFIILSTCFLFQSASGLYVLIYYTVDFVERLGTNYNPLTISTLLSITRLITSVTIGTYFWAKFSRKFTLAFSSIGMMLTLLGMGVYEVLFRDTGISSRPSQWVPIVLLFLYMVSSMVGMLVLPWNMAGEVYPLRVRGIMTCLTFLVGFCMMFISIKQYYMFLDILQFHGFLLALALFSFLAVPLAVLVLPETSDKSLFEIEQSFLPKNRVKEEHFTLDKTN